MIRRGYGNVLDLNEKINAYDAMSPACLVSYNILNTLKNKRRLQECLKRRAKFITKWKRFLVLHSGARRPGDF